MDLCPHSPPENSAASVLITPTCVGLDRKCAVYYHAYRCYASRFSASWPGSRHDPKSVDWRAQEVPYSRARQGSPWAGALDTGKSTGRAAGMARAPVAGVPRPEQVSGTWPPSEEGRGHPQRTCMAPARLPVSYFIKLPPRGVGVCGEFHGIEGDGTEAGGMFEPVNFSGMCVLLNLSLCFWRWTRLKMVTSTQPPIFDRSRQCYT
jgi:hypothetical protein